MFSSVVQNKLFVGTYRWVPPVFKNLPEVGRWVEQEEIPPLIKADV